MESEILEEKNQIKKSDSTDDAVKLRRYSDRLATAGTGVMLFAIWSIIKSIMQVSVGGDFEKNLSEISDGGEAAAGALVLVYVFIFATMALEVGVRIFIGMSGRAEGKGKKKSIVYIVLACILIPLYVIGIIYSIMNMSYIENSVMDTIVTLAVDITSLSALIELVFSGIRVKSLRKKIKQ